jgi:hypothetical protein
MNPSRKLAGEFAASVNLLVNGSPEEQPSRRAFLKDLDRETTQLAQALPYIVGHMDRLSRDTHILNLPAALTIENGEVALGEEKISYAQFRQLPGISQIISMARRADVDVQIDFYNCPKELTDLKTAFDPAHRKQWSGAYDQISITFDLNRPFDAAKYPAQAAFKAPAPRQGR